MVGLFGLGAKTSIEVKISNKMQPSQHTKILTTIRIIRESHPEIVNIYSYGSCMNFFVLLRNLYPEARAYYNVDHIITKIGNYYYDISGVVLEVKSYLPFTSYYNKRRTSRAFTQMMKGEYPLTKKTF